jgi:hypothetical protein
MEPTPELIQALHRDKIESARQMTPQQRLDASGELFDSACEVARAGIRMQHPEADERTVLELLRQRIALGERLEKTRVLQRDHARRG